MAGKFKRIAIAIGAAKVDRVGLSLHEILLLRAHPGKVDELMNAATQAALDEVAKIDAEEFEREANETRAETQWRAEDGSAD